MDHSLPADINRSDVRGVSGGQQCIQGHIILQTRQGRTLLVEDHEIRIHAGGQPPLAMADAEELGRRRGMAGFILQKAADQADPVDQVGGTFVLVVSGGLLPVLAVLGDDDPAASLPGEISRMRSES